MWKRYTVLKTKINYNWTSDRFYILDNGFSVSNINFSNNVTKNNTTANDIEVLINDIEQ